MLKKPIYQDDGIVTAFPEDVSVSSTQLKKASQRIINNNISQIITTTSNRYKNIDSLLIQRSGKLIFEKYYNNGAINKPHQMASLGKSYLSALVGIAIKKGALKNAEQPLLDILPIKNDNSWDTKKKKLSLKHLLTMTVNWKCKSEQSNFVNCADEMSKHNNGIEWLLDRPLLSIPGEKFTYNDVIPQVVSSIIAYNTRRSLIEFSEKELVKPLNLSTNLIASGQLTSRDMIKFGSLYLAGASSEYSGLLSKEWITSSTNSHYLFKNSLTRQGYGYLWWTRNFTVNKQKYSSFYAAGNGGQYIVIVPKLELVIALTGSNYNNVSQMSQSFDLIEKFILPAIKSHE